MSFEIYYDTGVDVIEKRVSVEETGDRVTEVSQRGLALGAIPDCPRSLHPAGVTAVGLYRTRYRDDGCIQVKTLPLEPRERDE
jgi:hypothetical protein